ncbi:MAG: lmo0937 family membrane protein [Gemmatimonadota bacterium]|nr:lmo0937 family membrane protein [Gemmatimonadota bacterium]
MFLTIALVLLVLWALGLFVFPIAGGLIHILLVIAVIAIIWHFVKGGRARV